MKMMTRTKMVKKVKKEMEKRTKKRRRKKRMMVKTPMPFLTSKSRSLGRRTDSSCTMKP
jgi:hypothetical protein